MKQKANRLHPSVQQTKGRQLQTLNLANRAVEMQPLSGLHAIDQVPMPRTGRSNQQLVAWLGSTHGNHHVQRWLFNHNLVQRETWRETGNLAGNPPVRDGAGDAGLPNKGIREEQSAYEAIRAAATAAREGQQTRADGMLNDDGSVTDQRYWFARVYQFVTEGELEEADRGTFFYPTYVMRSVLHFEKIYADNLAAMNANGAVEEHWRNAFTVAADNNTLDIEDIATIIGTIGGGALGTATMNSIGGSVAGGLFGNAVANALKAVQSLVASMLAHIRFDLPRAEAWVFNRYYRDMDQAAIANFMPDFMSMAGVFDRAALRLTPEIADRTGVPTTWVPRLLQDWAMKYLYEADMGQERATTWQRAEALVNLGLMTKNPYIPNAQQALTGNVTEQDHESPLLHLPAGLRPEMADPAAQQSDSAIRDQVVGSTHSLELLSTSTRIRMLQRLAQGMTFDDDEATMLTILQASARVGDVEAVVGGAGVWELCYAVDGAEYRQLRQFLRTHYYPTIPPSVALTLIRRCLDGETAEWEEEMVADLIVDRSDRRNLVQEIGTIYENGGFAAGLNKLQWQLDGADQVRVENALRN